MLAVGHHASAAIASARPLSDTGRVRTIEALCVAERLCFPLGTMFRSRSDDDSLEERNKSGKGWAWEGEGWAFDTLHPSTTHPKYAAGIFETVSLCETCLPCGEKTKKSHMATHKQSLRHGKP